MRKAENFSSLTGSLDSIPRRLASNHSPSSSLASFLAEKPLTGAGTSHFQPGPLGARFVQRASSKLTNGQGHRLQAFHYRVARCLVLPESAVTELKPTELSLCSPMEVLGRPDTSPLWVLLHLTVTPRPSLNRVR